QKGFLAGIVLGVVLVTPGFAQTTVAQPTFDTSTLPRGTGTREIYASAATTIFVTSSNVSRSAEAVRSALGEQGWQAYEPRPAAQAAADRMQTASFKRATQALSFFITIAPAQGNATSVQYPAVALKYDLPFPKDATEIVFDPDRPMLSLTTA